MGTLIFGVVILGAGVIATVMSPNTVWYGAMIVGVIEIVRGIIKLSNGGSRED